MRSFRCKQAVSFALCALTTFVLVTSATHASAGPTDGLCVVDASLKLSKNIGDYTYNSAASGNSTDGVAYDVPVTVWDVRLGKDTNGAVATTLMSLSYRLGHFSEGKCLDAVIIRPNGADEAPFPESTTGSKWKRLGHWYTSFAEGVIPSANLGLNVGSADYSSISGGSKLAATLFSRPMTRAEDPKKQSKWIVTGLEIQPYIECRPPIGGFCAGAWRDQQGNPKRLIVRMQPFEAFTKNQAVASISGQWIELVNCNNCNSEFQYQYGVTSGQAITKTEETYKSLSVALGLGGDIGPVSTSVEITGTLATTQSTAIQKSFETAASTTLSTTCERGKLFQWQTTATLNNKEAITANSRVFVCTANDDSPGPNNLSNISWGGCNAQLVMPPVVAPKTGANVVFTPNSGMWSCVR